MHEAIDQIIDGFRDADGATPPSPEPDPTGDGIEVVEGENHGPFTYRWPGGDDEVFTTSRWYILADQGREYRVLVAWTDREAWGRMRQRAVVFGESRASLYPWTEFVETDDGRYAAGISDPDHPRALLKQGAVIPDWFGTATVERTDRLFNGIRQGPSLRLVLGSDEEVRMVRHGYWVAGLRNRL
ncbi:MAG: hypothetical protein M0Z49_14740 [Chloroflexi bacterium]|nr:hypothetical protein [Chloroflexota bacterium]